METKPIFTYDSSDPAMLFPTSSWIPLPALSDQMCQPIVHKIHFFHLSDMETHVQSDVTVEIKKKHIKSKAPRPRLDITATRDSFFYGLQHCGCTFKCSCEKSKAAVQFDQFVCL